MTNQITPPQDWDGHELPVLTDVIEGDGVLDLPAFDFSAEMDALAQALPADNLPILELPAELTLDDVLGEDSDAGAALDASRLIDQLPSLDLEVDMPGELSLDDVLPGMRTESDPAPEAPPSDERDDFPFELDAAEHADAVPPADLSALFARATFEPLVPPTVAASEPALTELASVAALDAQLAEFEESDTLPELPADAFLEQHVDSEAEPQLLTAEQDEPVWAESWTPPVAATVEAGVVDDLPVLTVSEVAAVMAAVAEPEAETTTGAALPEVVPDVMPWVDVEEAPPQLSAPDAEQEAIVSQAPRQPPMPEVVAIRVGAANASEEETASVVEAAPLPAEPMPEAEATPVTDVEPADAGILSQQASSEEQAESVLQAASTVLPVISLDSLPHGVLGGGLGGGTVPTSPAATLGEPAANLPGGDWSLRPASASLTGADEREVELAWARDLGAEPPLPPDTVVEQDLSVPAAVSASEVEPIQVMRARRQPVAELDESDAESPAAAELPAIPEPPSAPAIQIASVTRLPLMTAGGALPVSGALTEAAVLEALYARVLPRMKVELTLWMQDALEQQAKQLMTGVMQQLKEDFDMMLAESLRESLREALDEAAHKEQ